MPHQPCSAVSALVAGKAPLLASPLTPCSSRASRWCFLLLVVVATNTTSTQNDEEEKGKVKCGVHQSKIRVIPVKKAHELYLDMTI